MRNVSKISIYPDLKFIFSFSSARNVILVSKCNLSQLKSQINTFCCNKLKKDYTAYTAKSQTFTSCLVTVNEILDFQTMA